MKRHVLVVAYYFPPMGLSGVQRVAKFVKYLPDFGWQPTVLTVQPGGYFAYDETLLHEVEAAGVDIHRVTSWDPTQLFGNKRTVPLPPEPSRRWLSALSQVFFIPDNKIGWYPHAVRLGKRLLRERTFDVIFSSAPPYSGHLVAAALHRASGVPLVTDFRDDWVGNPRHVYPTPLHRWANRRMEHYVLQQSHHVTTINDPIRRSLMEQDPTQRVTVLPQGFDPEDFQDQAPTKPNDKLRLVYCGIFYDAQSPDVFLEALARLVERRPAANDEIEAVFVGLVPDASKDLVATLGIDELVRYEGYVPHETAVVHLQAADVLWLTIGRRPGAEGISTGKLFEYLGARKPILALVPEGAARDVLEPSGAGFIEDPDDVPAVSRALERLYDLWKEHQLPRPDEAYVQQFERRALAGDLADILSESCE